MFFIRQTPADSSFDEFGEEKCNVYSEENTFTLFFTLCGLNCGKFTGGAHRV